ncbi:hypothetical protein Poli38472_014310 [Pythium oligandrum]|uniref:Guanine deaminase n=1 Tax=Pythium oligandrum TaxID=41045 RepID=A0A8K1FFJ0_PYTOL|nr:hypothetical protein Poli38472_014310 [Pythium oligandrum]|eukprot:TMW57707.1 hypothetical protein Poli38472_014310 [Pythium oligandrum]
MSRTATQRITAYKANVVHSLALNQLQVLEPGLVGVDAHGRIAYVLDLQKHSLEDATYDELVDLGDRLLIPGFVDGHAHAPQHSFVGVGMHLPLLDWLQTYTFPYEARFENVKYARSVYSKAVRRHLFNGTTTCSYFATIHLESCKALADIIQEVGQRGYVGKVNMDRNATTELTEKTETSIAHTREFVDYVLKKDSSLITPVLTPRFVPSTTSTLMNALADISREHNPPLPVQSHLSENPAEVAWVKSMHPDCDSYTDVYDRHGLLHDRSYMAHCIWCSKSERDILRNRKTGIIHCPNSNFSLSSGVLNVRRMLQEGIKVGLGTDVSGGYSPSMLDAIRQAVIASKLVSIGNSSAQEEGETTPDALTYAEAFHLATVGGAEALGLSDTVGNFVVGKEFDALVIDPFGENSPIDFFDEETDTQDVLQTFQKFLFLGDDRNIEAVFVQGKSVKPSALVKSA